MANKKENDLARPVVNVKVPEVRLKLEDLAYLRSLTQPKELRCHPGRAVTDRLQFLDLIARAKVGPDEERLKEAEKESKLHEEKILAGFKQKDWDAVYDGASELKHIKRELEPREEDVLTERGRELLRQGEVNVKIRRAGCL